MKDLSAFLSGMGSIFNIYGVQHHGSSNKISPTEADGAALRKDWEAVGADMRWAMGRVALNG